MLLLLIRLGSDANNDRALPESPLSSIIAILLHTPTLELLMLSIFSRVVAGSENNAIHHAAGQQLWVM